MVKKQPKNSFYFFMVDYKKREEEKGRRFYSGMKQVADECGPEWKLVSAEDKAKYEMMAKQAKLQRKMDSGQKYTSYGETFSEVERKAQEEERRKLEKKQKVEQIVQYLRPESTLRTKSFFVAHANYYFVNDKDKFHLPAEIAISEFSLERGIIGSLHFIIRPDFSLFTLGYAGTAKQHGDKTHRIPYDGTAGSSNIDDIYEKICKFMQGKKDAQGGELPPVFTLGHDEGQNTSDEAVCDCFKYIYNKTHVTHGDEDAWMDQFKVYDLSKLFYELKNKTARDDAFATSDGLKAKFPQQSLAENELRRDVFNYSPDIACSFHETEDNVANCSLSFVRRWVYLICDYCCQDLDIELIPGKHVPKKADVCRPSRLSSAASSRMPSRAPSRNAFSEAHYAIDDDDNVSMVSGNSARSLDYNALRSLNTEKSQMGRTSTKVTTESLRLPKTAKTGGRGSQLLGSSRSSVIDEKPGRTRTNSETSNKSVRSAKSEDTVKALRVDEREVTSVGKSLATMGIKPIDPSVYGIEILQGSDEIAAAEAARRAELAAQPPKPLFTPDSFPSLGGFGRGRKVSGRGK